MELTRDAPARRSSSAARSATRDVDEYVLVGGGLQNALVALLLLDRRPATRLTLIEREPNLGGNHTWSFHAGDVPREAAAVIDRLVVRRWPAHEVAFPGHRRRLTSAYASLTSEALRRHLLEQIAVAPHARIVTGSAASVQADAVTLEGGERLRAELVVDARGPAHAMVTTGGYQKFLGMELEIAAGAAPEVPMLMDATVSQLDGFRFMYCLPWSDTRVLLEDTYYSENAALDAPALRARILEYAAARGMTVRGVLREETGVLPIPSRVALARSASGPLSAGYAGGLFHPTTGYSLPVALRFALFVAERAASAVRGAEFDRWLELHARQVRFCELLNRLMFRGFRPEQRVHVLERFYRLPEDTIRRFYALETSATDQFRILCGRPPRGFSLRRWLSGGAAS